MANAPADSRKVGSKLVLIVMRDPTSKKSVAVSNASQRQRNPAGADIRPVKNTPDDHKKCHSITQHAFLLVVLLLVLLKAGSVGASRELPAGYSRYFRALGHRIRSYRTDRKLSQEDMISYGFSVRHWQMIEGGRPITLFTLLRICETFETAPARLLAGLAHHLGKRLKD